MVPIVTFARGAVVVAVLLAGCSTVPRGEGVPSGAPVTVPATLPVAVRALSQLGTPYRAGGADPGGFDCSGLVQWAYAGLGVRVPRTTEEQMAWFRPVPREALLPGDVVFFRLPQAHVGVYVGEGEFVHAPASGRAVERARIDAPWFILGFSGGGRVPPATP